MEEEIQMLESYFCQSGEFTKEVEYNSANACLYSLCIKYPINYWNETINVFLSLSITGEDVRSSSLFTNKNFSLTSNFADDSTSSTNSASHNDFKIRKFLSRFKKYLLDYIETESANEELSLFTICIWIQENLQSFLDQNYDIQPSELLSFSPKEGPKHKEEDSEHDIFYGVVIKLDHIRSKKRYFKFLQGTSRNLSLDIELIEVGRLLFLKVVSQNEDDAKEFIKTLRTTLVDIDSTGKPCKERMAEVLILSPLGRKPEQFSIDFKHTTFENTEQVYTYFRTFGLNI